MRIAPRLPRKSQARSHMLDASSPGVRERVRRVSSKGAMKMRRNGENSNVDFGAGDTWASRARMQALRGINVEAAPSLWRCVERE